MITTTENLTRGESPSGSPSCSASSDGRTLYEADCKKRPNYHDGKPRKTWGQLGDVEQWSWNRPAVMLKKGDNMGNLQPNLQHLCDDGKWKESTVKNGEMTKLLVGHYRVILPNDYSKDQGPQNSET